MALPSRDRVSSISASREQRTVLWGAVIVVLALFVVRVAVPFVQAAQQREARIDVAADRLAQLRGVAAQQGALAQAADVAERELAGAPRRVLHATSAALAASALQSLLQNATDGAGMVVNRVDVSPDAATGDVAGSLAVVGDIHGLATLLATLERGPRVVVVEKLSVTQNSALRGAPDVLQVTLAVRAPVVLE